MNHESLNPKENSIQWLRLLIGLAIVFAIFHWTATALGSDRGQFGILVGILVITALLFAEKILFGRSFMQSVGALGLTRPSKIGLLIAVGISVLMLLTVLIFALLTNSTIDFYPGWYWLIPGLFFQAGIAEETLFRGYLFGYLRERRSFWKAAVWAAIPFVSVHLIMFYSMPWVIALASIALSVIMSFPFARFYELAGNTIWAAAIIHFIAQGTVKVLVVSGDAAAVFPLFWILVCALIPLGVFLFGTGKKENLEKNV